MASRKRIEVSNSTLEQLENLAEYYGHNNPAAALATLAKFGIPLLIGSPAPVQKHIEPTLRENSSLSALQNGTLAESLGFRYSKSNSSQLVEEALARRDDNCVEKPGYAEVTDEAVAALSGFVDSF